MIEQIIKVVRESEELGEGSCSYIDECFNDVELTEEITETIEALEAGNIIATVKSVFDELLRIEKLRFEHDREMEIGYGEERISAEEMMRVAKEDAEYRQSLESKCAECGRQGEFYSGMCYQCEAELHMLGGYDMDGEY